MSTSPLRPGFAALIAALGVAPLAPAPLGAQGYDAGPVATIATQLQRLAPISDRSAPVRDLVLRRDIGVFRFSNGRIWFLTEVNGRTVGLAFVGEGTFSFTAPTAVERSRLRLFLRADSVADRLTSAVLLFNDSTEAEVLRQVRLDTLAAPRTVGNDIEDLLDYNQSQTYGTWNRDLLDAFLNGAGNGYFFALVDRAEGEDLAFQIAPDERESVTLQVDDRGAETGKDLEVVASFPRRDALPGYRGRSAQASAYTIRTDLPQSLDGGVSFSATAEATLVADAEVGPWISASLYPELVVDSALLDGAPIPFYKRKDSHLLFLRLPAPLRPGASQTLRLAYHGSLVERFGDNFYIKSSIDWYPVFGDGLNHATFDLTFRTPAGYSFASIGERADSVVSGRVLTTRWSRTTPARNASFNLGLFDARTTQVEGAPPVTILYSDKGHRALAAWAQAVTANDDAAGTGLLQMRDPMGTMTREVSNAARFYTRQFGPPPVDRLTASEIPWNHGEAWPGLIGLPFSTFHETSTDGYDEMLRAHEVAHQWFAVGVDFSSYRDQWLSEGFSTFAALWYVQTSHGDTRQYFGLLDRFHREMTIPERPRPPVSLGQRGNTGRDPRDGTLSMYWKGAWTLHMLRTLMLQFSTMSEDRFTAGMREFYSTYQGRHATTEDFRRTMEKHAGADLGWFFEQWIDGTTIPTYGWAWRAEREGAQTKVKIRVRQTEVPESFQMYVPVTVELRDGRMLRTRIRVAGPLTETELPALPGEVKSVKFNDLEGVLAEVKAEGW